ncbi:ABC transporter permease [Paenibacillus thalictri]|uniref:ABC transporter permease n=1 Tax=Paenibacillus thalictri TaxID=2527873 RepID=A0A4Q9DYH0_9BACL|nr:ABC transporter permease [Paenibacillus thalictri]TBL80290.1 ABC transporter permease [Paenibacillus thalictri]
MALFVMILRKMIKNKWLELSLLVGLILSVGLASSMPLYTAAILQRMLVKDLDLLQATTFQYSGNYWASIYLTGSTPKEDIADLLHQTDDYFTSNAHRWFNLPIKEFAIERATDRYPMEPLDPTRIDPAKTRTADVTAIKGMENHIRVVDGRLPEPPQADGVYEAVVVENALSSLKLVVGNEFILKNEDGTDAIRVKIVGVIDQKSYDDVFWFNKMTTYSSSLIVPFDLFENDFTKGQKLQVRASYWQTALDYSKMTLPHIERYIGTHNAVDQFLSEHYENYSIKPQAMPTLTSYYDKEDKLRMMLWSLNVPVMMMLAFYLFMVSNLITERQKTEIAVLRSRGASRLQILCGYLIEGLLLGGIAFAVGPHFGLLLTKVLGASNGFLEFVQRAALDVRMNDEAYQYGAIAVACSLVMTLIPAFLATRATIVGHKQQMARQQKKSFWHTFFIDIILVAVSVYGLQTFRRRMADMVALGLDSSDLKIDPLLFVVPALFILGSGLVILRIYPWFVRLIYWLGKRWWPPSLYSTLIQVGRSTTQYQFIMVFLIITLATGLFSSSAARTININAAEKISYSYGTDIAMQVNWENDAPPPGMETEPVDSGEMFALPLTLSGNTKVQYSEPPFLPMTQLSGVEHAAKVFKKQVANITVGKERADTLLMGIDTDDFGQVAWLRNGLLDHHFNEYLNLMASDPAAVLISRSVAEHFKLKEGDRLYAGWPGVENTQFKIFGIIDYWPSWNPRVGPGSPGAATAAKNKKAVPPMLVVGHLSYIQNNMALEPYEVWLKLKDGASSQELYAALEDKNIPVEHLSDAKQELIKLKNDPFQLAINGVMTLGFMISVMISFFGFLLYWVLSLSGRILQFGILRAMGISFSQLIFMLIGEQLLTSGAAVGIGLSIGTLTGLLYVPMFQLAFNASTQVPPFLVTFDSHDQVRLYVIVSAMISFGLIILGYMLSRIKIHQAVKLGED